MQDTFECHTCEDVCGFNSVLQVTIPECADGHQGCAVYVCIPCAVDLIGKKLCGG